MEPYDSHTAGRQDGYGCGHSGSNGSSLYGSSTSDPPTYDVEPLGVTAQLANNNNNGNKDGRRDSEQGELRRESFGNNNINNYQDYGPAYSDTNVYNGVGYGDHQYGDTQTQYGHQYAQDQYDHGQYVQANQQLQYQPQSSFHCPPQHSGHSGHSGHSRQHSRETSRHSRQGSQQQQQSRHHSRQHSGEQQPEPTIVRPDRVNRMGTVRDNVADESEAGHRPYFVGFVVLLCGIMFLVEMSKAGWRVQPFRDNPMLGPDPQALLAAGAKRASLIREGQWYRLIAPIFLHAGIVHVIMNLSVMVGLGRDLEAAYGSLKVALLFFMSGIFGILMSCLFIPETIGVGASGALFGLVGAMFGDFIHNYDYIQEGRTKYFLQLVASAAVGLIIGLVPFIDNYAHFGGFSCGLLASIPVLFPSAPKPQEGEGYDPATRPKRHTFLAVICAITIAVGFILAFALFYSGVNAQNCKYCKYINCVPTPWWVC